MFHGHDNIIFVFCPRDNIQWCVGRDVRDKGMIPRPCQRVGQSHKQAVGIMFDQAGFSMIRIGGAHGFTAEDLADTLVPQTHAQNRDAGVEMPDDIIANACLGRCAWTGRQNNGVRRIGRNLVERDGIIAHNRY